MLDKSLEEMLSNIEIYKQYPQLKPFIGNKYFSAKVKLLVIGESHYLPKNSTVHLDAQSWYAGNENNLNNDEKSEKNEKKWIHTRCVFNNWKKHSTYRKLFSVLLESQFCGETDPHHQIAFMNAYQRPAVCTKSIKVKEEDTLWAIKTINKVVEIIKPDLVIFVSKKAGRIKDALNQDTEMHIVAHPACSWWNRPYRGGLSGRERFRKILIDKVTKFGN